ncbi:hypothetical protein J6590_030827 [Homalodisca vitripennis]|nr:hypothetical protein J6590_030827 [Homalodisca vitripennis]
MNIEEDVRGRLNLRMEGKSRRVKRLGRLVQQCPGASQVMRWSRTLTERPGPDVAPLRGIIQAKDIGMSRRHHDCNPNRVLYRKRIALCWNDSSCFLDVPANWMYHTESA